MVLDNGTTPIVHVSNWNDILNPDGSFVAEHGSPGVISPWSGMISSPTPFHDDSFISQMKDAIAAIPVSCPLIIIGHSFGGDSVLSLVDAIGGRVVDFLGLLDPVGEGGYRTPVVIREIPPNIKYFFNRYQQTNPFPLENLANVLPPILLVNLAFTADGHFYSRAKFNDQRFQNFRRKANGNYLFNEISLGFGSIPTGIPQLLLHGVLPHDGYIQSQIMNTIRRRVLNPNPWIIDAQPLTTYENFQEYVRGVRVQFSEAIQPSTFSLADVGLDGGHLTGINVVAGSDNKEFDILFEPLPTVSFEWAHGHLELGVGPEILDVNDRLMDQDRDGSAGEAQDDKFWFTMGTTPIDPSIALGNTIREIEATIGRYLADLVNWRDLPNPMLSNLLADFTGLSVVTEAPMISLALNAERAGYGVLTLALKTTLGRVQTRRFAIPLSPEAAAIQKLYRQMLHRDPDYGEVTASINALITARPNYDLLRSDLRRRAALTPSIDGPT
jgi:hypothetical protein